MPDKATLRRQLRGVLARLGEDIKAASAAALRNRLASWPVFQQATVIALFHPTAIEPNLLPLLRVSGKTFLFPLCHPDRSLSWHAPEHLDQWRPSPFGILEPDPALSPALPAGSIDLVLVPGLAFTLTGDRLGHGAGFYDRFLASLPPVIPTAGICFSCQILSDLPALPHDVRVRNVFHA